MIELLSTDNLKSETFEQDVYCQGDNGIYWVAERAGRHLRRQVKATTEDKQEAHGIHSARKTVVKKILEKVVKSVPTRFHEIGV